MNKLLNDIGLETHTALHDRPTPDRHPKARGGRPTREIRIADPAIGSPAGVGPLTSLQSFRSLAASLPLRVAEALYEAATQISSEGGATEVDEARQHALDLLAADPASTPSDFRRISRQNVEAFVMALKPYEIAAPGGRLPDRNPGAGDRF